MKVRRKERSNIKGGVMMFKSKEKRVKELKVLIPVQIELLCALNRELGKNIHEYVKLEGVC